MNKMTVLAVLLLGGHLLAIPAKRPGATDRRRCRSRLVLRPVPAGPNAIGHAVPLRAAYCLGRLGRSLLRAGAVVRPPPDPRLSRIASLAVAGLGVDGRNCPCAERRLAVTWRARRATL